MARKDNLVVQELRGETLVYDLKRNKAHCLNGPAAFVWSRCNGQTDVEELARALARDLRKPVDEDIVRLALKQLQKADLLSHRPLDDAPEHKVSRREVMRRLGAGSALAIPMVTSLVAPAAAAAASVPAECLACTQQVENNPNPCPPLCLTINGGCYNNNSCDAGGGGYFGMLTCEACHLCKGNSNGWRASNPSPTQVVTRCCSTGNSNPTPGGIVPC